jgi:hypothetical protein
LLLGDGDRLPMTPTIAVTRDTPATAAALKIFKWRRGLAIWSRAAASLQERLRAL